jgi:cysteinyl-tRNA synthetase
MILILGILFLNSNVLSAKGKNYRKLMVDFVIEISKYAKKQKAEFIVISQNAPELLTREKYRALPDRKYLNAIDGIGIESLNFGHNDSRISRSDYLAKTNFLRHAINNKKAILITEYSRKKNNIRLSGRKNKLSKYVTFHAPSRDLDRFPKGLEKKSNRKNIRKLGEIQNFLYLINPQNYNSKKRFLNDLKNNNYDLIIIDAFFGEKILSKKEIVSLKTKKNGKKRLIISYLSIGEAEDYRKYWKKIWNKKRPSWIEEENPNWPGNYAVRYWYRSWKKIVFGKEKSYLDKIIKNGFDGVYLDTIDSYEYFQRKQKF